LSDAANYSIHNYQDYNPVYGGGSVTGAWQPDGSGLSAFQGTGADGTWALFVADESSGGVMTLNGWGLTVETTPEPSVVALSLLGLGGMLTLRRRKRARALSNKEPSPVKSC
jgi:hypothetical protein